jgi:hypothetical protein
MEPLKVVCVDNSSWKYTLTIGKEYTCIAKYGDKLHFAEFDGGFYAHRFRELEKMQATNFIELVGKGE